MNDGTSKRRCRLNRAKTKHRHVSSILAHVVHPHERLRAILDKAASSDTLTDPVQLYDFLDAASRSVSVDDTLSNGGMRALALKMNELRPDDVLFLRVPVAGLGRDAGGLTMQLDPTRASQLWTAVQHGTTASFVKQHSRDALGSVTR